jgi:hypothetical protein
MRRSALVSTLVSALLLTTAMPVSAHHLKDVLGDATSTAQVQFPAIAAGPGMILPDSPLYFLDEITQDIKVAFAFSPEKKAKLRSQIAGERLAELRVMLERNNTQGIQTALTNLNKEATLASSDLSDAAAQGKDVKKLAKELNTTIKEQRKVLGDLSDQTDGTLRLQLKASREALKEAKLNVEDQLPENELENELKDTMNEDIEDEVKDASRSARGLEHSIDILEKLASEAAAKNQTQREAALRHAIEIHNENLQRQEKKRAEQELKKEQRKNKLRNDARKAAREAVRKSQEAAANFQQVQQLKQEDEQEDQTTVTSTQSTNSGSGDSRSGGSGESSSGGGHGSDDH